MTWLHVAILMAAIRPVHPDIPSRFVAWECGTSQGKISYRVFLPDIGGRPIPLVIWMHGRGEMGNNNRDQLAWLELFFHAHADGQRPEFGILAYQCPEDGNGWFARREGCLGPLEKVELAIQDLCGRAPIATHRIYLVGISQGAAAAVAVANRNPSRYAAMLLMGPSGLPESVTEEAARIPVWVFQSRGDGLQTLERTSRYASDVRKLGGSAQFTVIDSTDHDCWTDAVFRYRATAWLLKHGQGEQEWRAVTWAAMWAGMCVVCVLMFGRRCFLRSKRWPTSAGRCSWDSSWGLRPRPSHDVGANGPPGDVEHDSRERQLRGNDVSGK